MAALGLRPLTGPPTRFFYPDGFVCCVGVPDRAPAENMTTQTPPAGSWKALQTSLKEEATGERHPFFPIRDVPTDVPVKLKVLTGPHFDGFHGQYSLVELDVQVREGTEKGKNYRLCVSGARLARALAGVEPQAGDPITVTARGTGKERQWTVAKA